MHGFQILYVYIEYLESMHELTVIFMTVQTRGWNSGKIHLLFVKHKHLWLSHSVTHSHCMDG